MMFNMRNIARAIMLIMSYMAIVEAMWNRQDMNSQSIMDNTISYLFSWSIAILAADIWWCAPCTHVLHTHVIRTVFIG